jgi:peptidyl-dipeptidase Dcp
MIFAKVDAARDTCKRNVMDTQETDNPLLGAWNTPFEAPPFAAFAPEHFAPAFARAMAEHREEIEAVATVPDPASFANTIEALERSGRRLDRVAAVFFNLVGTDGTEAMLAIEREMAPALARHNNAIYLDERLFRRVEALWQGRAGLGLTEEQTRVLERYRIVFRRSGAGLDAAAKRRFAEIGERLAALGTRFSQNVLADETSYKLVLETEADLAGLPDLVRAEAARAAADHGLAGKHIVTLARSSVEPFLQFSSRRDLREEAFRHWSGRGESPGDTDNRGIIAETVALRAEQAHLLGYPSFAHFRLDDSMAKTPQTVADFLHSVWGPARARAEEERAALQRMASADGVNEAIAPWDWRFYAERRRKAAFDFDDAAIKPYLQLDNMIEAAFATAQRLFGLRFVERHDVPLYHPDVRAFEVTDADGRHLGLFLGDYFARSSKRGGAWATGFRGQRKLGGEVRPIVVNVMNFARADDGPTLLGFDDARTLFHEFGHALHGLLSDVTYPLISGTSVARDFVEFPSQLYEHWLEQPQVLQRFAVHYRTGEPMPPDLLERLLAARRFNQGFATVEYLASALVDLELHLEPDPGSLDIGAFERAALARLGMPGAITMRHRPTHFTHVFSGDGYSSSYYSYLWSEILDADGFAAFEEAGDVFDPALAARLREHVYAAGDLREPADAYRLFRGRMPQPDAVLRQRGLLDVAAKSLEGADA